MAEGLRIKVGADIIEFTRSINQVEQEIKDLSKSIKGLSGQDLVRANKELDKLNETAQRLRNVGRQGFDQFGVALNGIGGRAGSASSALNSLGQVARDLPFGFIAIQNNLPIVFDQFGQLIQTSGGVGKALKGIAASLIGPAGVTFAIGAAIAGATALIQKYGSLENAINSLFFSTDKLTRQRLLLDQVNKDANKSAGEELARLSVLIGVSQDTTNSLRNRKEAANELIKVYGEYLPGLKQEAILNGDVARETEKAKDAIIAKALAAGAERALAEQSAKVLDIVIRQNQEAEKYQRLVEKISEAEQKRQKITGAPNTSVQTSIDKGLLQGVKETLGSLGTELNQAQDDFKFLTDLAVDFAKKAGGAFIKTGATVKGAIPVKIEKGIFDFATVEVDKNNTALNKALEDFRKKTIETTKLDVPLNLTIPQASFDALRKIGEDKSLAFLQEKTKAITSQFNDFLAPAIDTAFGALANGQNIGQALAQSFKALLVQLTATVVKALALKAILSALNLGTGGAAGGIAGVIGGIAGAISGGGIANPSFGGLSSGGLQLGGSVNLSVRGTDLVGAINGANSQIRRVG